MKWKYGKKPTEEQIEQYLTTFPQTPKELLAIIEEHDGGRPVFCYFDTEKEMDREFKRLLSIDKDEPENVYFFYDNSPRIPFGISSGGDLFLLDKESGAVLLQNHETLEDIIITESFTEFINILHD